MLPICFSIAFDGGVGCFLIVFQMLPDGGSWFLSVFPLILYRGAWFCFVFNVFFETGACSSLVGLCCFPFGFQVLSLGGGCVEKTLKTLGNTGAPPSGVNGAASTFFNCFSMVGYAFGVCFNWVRWG